MAAKFTIVKKGYDPKEVYSYIEKLEADLKEYADKEASISKALVNAQVASNKLLEDANWEADKIRRDAKTDAENTRRNIMEEFKKEIETVQKMVNGERRALEEFCMEYDNIVKNYFTGSSFEITVPLREKINLIESIIQDADEAMSITDNSDKDENFEAAAESETAESGEASGQDEAAGAADDGQVSAGVGAQETDTPF